MYINSCSWRPCPCAGSSRHKFCSSKVKVTLWYARRCAARGVGAVESGVDVDVRGRRVLGASADKRRCEKVKVIQIEILIYYGKLKLYSINIVIFIMQKLKLQLLLPLDVRRAVIAKYIDQRKRSKRNRSCNHKLTLNCYWEWYCYS